MNCDQHFTLHSAEAAFGNGVLHDNDLALNNTTSRLNTDNRNVKTRQSRTKDQMKRLVRKKQHSTVRKRQQGRIQTIVPSAVIW